MRGSFLKKGSKNRLPGFADPEPTKTIRRATREQEWFPIGLVGINRHMERWAVGQGKGISDPDNALLLKSTLPPLTDNESITTDLIVCGLIPRWQNLVHWWFRSEKSVDQISHALKVRREQLLPELHIVLGIILGALRQRGVKVAIYQRND